MPPSGGALGSPVNPICWVICDPLAARGNDTPVSLVVYPPRNSLIRFGVMIQVYEAARLRTSVLDVYSPNRVL
jgi:hypothetical protein